MEQLFENQYLSPNDKHNEAPSAQEILDFMQHHPTVFAHGYVVSPYRDDYRVSLTGVEVEAKHATLITKAAVLEFCKNADEIETDKGLYCDWD